MQYLMFLFVTKCSFGVFRDDSTQFKENQPQRLEQHGNLVPVASCQLYLKQNKIKLFFFPNFNLVTGRNFAPTLKDEFPAVLEISPACL